MCRDDEGHGKPGNECQPYPTQVLLALGPIRPGKGIVKVSACLHFRHLEGKRCHVLAMEQLQPPTSLLLGDLLSPAPCNDRAVDQAR